MVTNTIWYRPYYIFTNKLIDVTIYFYLNHFVATFYYFRNANWESTNDGYIDVGDKSILVTIFGCWRRLFDIVVIFWNVQVYIRWNICDSRKDSLFKTWMMSLHFGSFKRSLLRSLLFSYCITVGYSATVYNHYILIINI